MIRNWIALSWVFLEAALIGCTGGDGDGGSASTPGAADGSVKVGGLHSLSGTMAISETSLKAVSYTHLTLPTSDLV